jgi:hypothetical protein
MLSAGVLRQEVAPDRQSLAAQVRQAVDDVGLDVEQAEFENLKQTHGTGANNDGIAANPAHPILLLT